MPGSAVAAVSGVPRGVYGGYTGYREGTAVRAVKHGHAVKR